MIIPVLFLFQLLLGGTLYATNYLIKSQEQQLKYKKYTILLSQMFSQIFLQKIVTAYHLDDTYFDLFSLVRYDTPLIRGRKSIYIFGPYIQKEYLFIYFNT